MADKPVSIAVSVWIGYEPILLARSKGWLDERQVHLVEVASATDCLKLLAEGKVDGAALTLDEALIGRARGIPLSIVMIFDVSTGADMLIARLGIKQLNDLKGRRIGYEPGAVGALMLDQVLRAAGLKKEDVKLVALAIDKQHDAWTHDKVDAAINYEPVASQLLASGGHKLFDSRQIPNTILDVLAIRGEILDHPHASAIRQLISAHFRAIGHLNRNPQDAAYRMATHLGLSPANVLSAFKGLVLPDAVNNYRLMTGPSPELLRTARKLSEIMVKNELLKQDDTMISLIRADFLPTDFQAN
ncbi:MAG: ABC transporter substrate-binding protein [Betaproteobacteria bacterium]|nr:ABC transporter substrate-binding protein [Betaproteobacteria bacterium]